MDLVVDGLLEKLGGLEGYCVDPLGCYPFSFVYGILFTRNLYLSSCESLVVDSLMVVFEVFGNICSQDCQKWFDVQCDVPVFCLLQCSKHFLEQILAPGSCPETHCTLQ